MLSEGKRVVDIFDYYEKDRHSLMVLEYLDVRLLMFVNQTHLAMFDISFIGVREESCLPGWGQRITLSPRRSANIS